MYPICFPSFNIVWYLILCNGNKGSNDNGGVGNMGIAFAVNFESLKTDESQLSVSS